MVFLGDSIAYFVGMRFGKHRLAEKLSPKKSIEGAIGGGVASVGAALFWLHVIQPTISREWYWKMILFSVIGGMLAQFGDLFESLLKRSQQIKDSGQFLPGHGGILDRVDGLAIITPFFYFFLRFVLGES
jgi:phosphatidate cytidylyltransferase